jgi:hypothetical protein
MDSKTDIAAQYGYENFDIVNVKNIRHQHIFIKDLNWESKYIHMHFNLASYCIIKKVLKRNTIVFNFYLSIYYRKS